MVEFAIEKLLCQTHQPGFKTLTPEQSFAVMSRRLALDFSSHLNGVQRKQADSEERIQVEKHMRVCLGVHEGLDSITTVAASEPMLTEAAAAIMRYGNFKSCAELHKILEWPGLNKGERGELITSNITIDALDRYMFQGEKKRLSRPIVPLTAYFEHLFKKGFYEAHIKNAKPSKLRCPEDDKTFAETFKGAHLYVTHFIKIHDCSVLSLDFLMRLAVRGVGVVCPDNQAGIDIVLPAVYKDTTLRKDNMTVILEQSKNSKKFSTSPKDYLFAAMSPFSLRIFDRSMPNPPPVIQMIYSLASRRPIVHVMERGSSSPRFKKSADAFTSFDIWCGPASSEVFGTIQPEDDGTYRDLLKQSKPVPQLFKPDNKNLEGITRSMYPGATSHPDHWSCYAPIGPNYVPSIDFVDSDDGEEVEHFISLPKSQVASTSIQKGREIPSRLVSKSTAGQFVLRKKNQS
jgi:hypothetical protein